MTSWANAINTTWIDGTVMIQSLRMCTMIAWSTSWPFFVPMIWINLQCAANSVVRHASFTPLIRHNVESWSRALINPLINNCEKLISIRNSKEVTDDEKMIDLELTGVLQLYRRCTTVETDWESPKPQQGCLWEVVVQSLSIVLPINGTCLHCPGGIVQIFCQCFPEMESFTWYDSGCAIKDNYLLLLNGQYFTNAKKLVTGLYTWIILGDLLAL